MLNFTSIMASPLARAYSQVQLNYIYYIGCINSSLASIIGYFSLKAFGIVPATSPTFSLGSGVYRNIMFLGLGEPGPIYSH